MKSIGGKYTGKIFIILKWGRFTYDIKFIREKIDKFYYKRKFFFYLRNKILKINLKDKW